MTNSKRESPAVEKSNLVRLTDAIVKRLGARHELTSIARAVLQGMTEDQGGSFVGETETGSMCWSPPPQGATVTYVCSKADFTCAEGADFTCGQGSRIHVTHLCGDQTEDFDCKDTFKCEKENDAESVFDCYSFDCGVKGDKTNDKFDCNADFDFFCGGTDFECFDTFECTGEHVFLCGNKFFCEDVFYCKAGDGCAKKTVPYKCNPPEEKYAPAPPEDGDPGDFQCGLQTPGIDGFVCKGIFKCLAYDDFTCTKTTAFICGDGKGTDLFDCSPTKEHPTVQFYCRQTFLCYLNHVDCGTPDAYGGCTEQVRYTQRCYQPHAV